MAYSFRQDALHSLLVALKFKAPSPPPPSPPPPPQAPKQKRSTNLIRFPIVLLQAAQLPFDDRLADIDGQFLILHRSLQGKVFALSRRRIEPVRAYRLQNQLLHRVDQMLQQLMANHEEQLVMPNDHLAETTKAMNFIPNPLVEYLQDMNKLRRRMAFFDDQLLCELRQLDVAIFHALRNGWCQNVQRVTNDVSRFLAMSLQ